MQGHSIHSAHKTRDDILFMLGFILCIYMFYLTVDRLCKHVGLVPGLKIKFYFSFILFTLLGINGKIVYFNSKLDLKNRNNIYPKLQVLKILFISTDLFFRLFISAHIVFKRKSFYLKVCALMYVYVILAYSVKIILSLNEFHHAY